MVYTLGNLYSDGEGISSARQNATSVLAQNGSVLVAIPVATQTGLMHALDTSGGLNLDEVYFRSADGLSIKNVRRKHLHNAATDEAGGELNDIFIYNPDIIVFGWNQGLNYKDLFLYTTGGSSLTDVVDSTGHFLRLNSTWSGSVGEDAEIAVPQGASTLGFVEKILGIVNMYCDFGSGQVARMGFGMEFANNTIDTTRKFGFEMCDATGNTWQAVTCNGVTRTVTASGIVVNPVQSAKGYRFYFNPTNATIKFSNSDGTVKPVTTTIPSGGFIDPNRTWRMGIQTTNSTEKHMYVYGLKYIGLNVSPLWFNIPE